MTAPAPPNAPTPQEAAATIRQALNLAPTCPSLAIILGSGLGEIAHRLQEGRFIAYQDIPGFLTPTISGHAGRLWVGRLKEVPILLLQGRFHYYEGTEAWHFCHFIRTLKALGVTTLYLTCAAGSLNLDLPPGRLMAIEDHINLMGFNPLIGAHMPEWGERFPAMGRAWDPVLLDGQRRAAARLGLALGQGTYVALPGPNFETRAEIRMLRSLGADAVGMSTVPECLVANHCGLRVMGTAILTNYGEGLCPLPEKPFPPSKSRNKDQPAADPQLSHAQTLAIAASAAKDFEQLLLEQLHHWPQETR
jgi:xanthosine phosphorylase